MKKVEGRGFVAAIVKLAVVIHSNEPETAWNAVRLGNYARKAGDEVKVFLVGPGVEIEDKSTDKFPIQRDLQTFVDAGGHVLACGTCLKSRGSSGTELCPLSTLKDLYELVRDSDKVISF